MKLGFKLLVAPIITALVVYAVAQINTVLLDRSRGAAEDRVAQVLKELGTVTAVQDQLGRVHAAVYRTVSLAAALDEAKIKGVKADTEKQVGAMSKSLEVVGQSLDPTDKVGEKLVEVKKQLAAYGKQANQSLDFAMVDPNTGAVAMQDADTTFQSVGKAMAEIVAQLDTAVQTSLQDSRNSARTTSLILALVGFVAAAGAIGLSWWVQRHIVSDLARAVKVANSVASGDLSVEVASDRSDEVGDLIRALGQMREQLSRTLGNVLESGGAISVSSSEIARGTHDLSLRTEQTASNLQQTASSMGQLTETVRHSAESARAANQLAGSAANVASRGGNLVGQMVATMDEINTSSRKIADIISVIDGIAFQTNILALNAAVEAARAGEQGRGFAVVASEVRSLAGRSAEAAKEIKALIEASVSKVDGGLHLVAEAGQTMNEIVSAVRSVTDMISSITAAAAEQSDEIGQINHSIAQLDQMTQQNAALVEESTAAAESLKDQATRMEHLVGTFHLAGVHPSRALGYQPGG